MFWNVPNVLYFHFLFQPNGNGYTDGHGLVTIKMKPDKEGRFGFNVKVRTSTDNSSLYFLIASNEEGYAAIHKEVCTYIIINLQIQYIH